MASPASASGSDHVQQPQVDGGRLKEGGMLLYRAAMKDDWESARFIIQEDGHVIAAHVHEEMGSALHVAVAAGSNHFVRELVNSMPKETLCVEDQKRRTALDIAAIVGNTDAATMLIEKNPTLLYHLNGFSRKSVTEAAVHARRDTYVYLLNAISKNQHLEPQPFPDDAGVLGYAIYSEYYDLAMDIAERFPHLAKAVSPYSGILALARKPDAFRRGSHLNFWERLIYDGIPLQSGHCTTKREDDVENPAATSRTNSWNFVHLVHDICNQLHIMIWEVIHRLVPVVKKIKSKKLMHNQALRLLKLLCKQLEPLTEKEIVAATKFAVLEAARRDNPEFIEEILEIYPQAILYQTNEKRHIFHLAVLNRSENVFNLAHQMSNYKHVVMTPYDKDYNSLLHLAGRLAPYDKLNLVSGAALQMQQELQWFKEVEKHVDPVAKIEGNYERKNPQMIFTENHKELVIQGEKWLRDTANSCSIVAVLIVTIVFAAAITVPGGNDDQNGLPNFLADKRFIIFAISDAISLFTSTTSLLMFLAILTSRYAERDFLYALPRKLIIGLVTLFISITFMMIAFGSTVYLMFGQGKAWILTGVLMLGSLPITSFALLQFPLLLDAISSTYGPGIFGKKSDRILI